MFCGSATSEAMPLQPPVEVRPGEPEGLGGSHLDPPVRGERLLQDVTLDDVEDLLKRPAIPREPLRLGAGDGRGWWHACEVVGERDRERIRAT